MNEWMNECLTTPHTKIKLAIEKSLSGKSRFHPMAPGLYLLESEQMNRDEKEFDLSQPEATYISCI